MIRNCCLLIVLAASTASAVDLSFDPRPMSTPRSANSRYRQASRRPAQYNSQPASHEQASDIPDSYVVASSWQDQSGAEQPPAAEEVPTFPALEETPTDDLMSPVPMGEEIYDQFDEYSEPMDPPAPTLSSGRWINRGCWYAQEDITYYVRATRKGTPLATDLSNFERPALRSHLRTSTGLGFAPGARLTIGRFLGRDSMNRDSSVEFTFLGLNEWFNEKGLQSLDANQLVTPFDPTEFLPGFDFTNQQTYQYVSKFNSYELNFRISRRLDRDRITLTRDGTWVRTVTPHLLPTIFAGLRLLTLNEEFNWIATNTNPNTQSGQYNIRTHNALFGPQFGTDITYQQANWRVVTRLKGGPMINWADQITDVQTVSFGTFAERNASARTSTLAFAGELNVIGVYLFRPNMGLRASYDFIGISNLALADKQITFNQLNPPFFTTSRGVFITGISFGFECCW